MTAATVEDQNTFTIEVTDVADRGEIKCQCNYMLKVPRTKIVLIRRLFTCPNPATKRVKATCVNGHEKIRFACDKCLKDLFRGRFVCGMCLEGLHYAGDM